MKIGVPKEIKNNENRVGLTPASVEQLVKDGHSVYVEKNAGSGIGLLDQDYTQAGAIILESPEEIFMESTLIVKVKEPQKKEIKLLKPHHILYTYLHLAADLEQTEGLIQSGATCIAYETIQLEDKSTPLLSPMSQVAGRMATQVSSFYLQKNNGGKGILPGGVPGTKRANYVILGAGVAGMNALQMAIGLGARVTILDIDIKKLNYIDSIYGNKVDVLFSNEENIRKSLIGADVVIGTILIPGAKAPKLIKKEHLSLLEKGSVLVDVAIDQGGCFETSKATTHQDPIYFVEGILHYCVANMPGAFAQTSTYALNTVTLKYAREIASNGLKNACEKYKELLKGINVTKGRLVYEQVAIDLNLPFQPIEIKDL